MKFHPHILLTHTYSASISLWLYVSLGICYQSYGTTRKNSCESRHMPPMGVMTCLNQYQLPLHKITIIYTSLLMFLKQKWCGKVKARGCADGQKQCAKIPHHGSASPTVANESVLLTAVANAYEG